jgi:hypothetical protein
MPAGSTLSFITSYKVPDLRPQLAEGTCIPNGPILGADANAGSATTANIRILSGVSAATNPASLDRNGSNDNTVTIVPMAITRCPNELQVQKTALTPQLPLDRTVVYQIVATNTSGANLDLPRIIDAFDGDAPATIECTATTLGALCPSFEVFQDVRYFGDGATGPITYQVSPSRPTTQFDFSWGSPGTATMRPGSSVTFRVTVQYPAGFIGASRNDVVFTADLDSTNGLWPGVGSTASVNSPTGSPLAISKSVSKIALLPGEVTTFAIDVLNTGGGISAAFLNDSMNPLFAPTNPSGFSDLQCRPLIASDGVLLPDTPVGSTPCPTFTSDAAGIRGTIVGFASNSGLSLTYTAVAPLTSLSIPNLVTITNSRTVASVGDSASQVNVLTVVAFGDGSPPGAPGMANTGVSDQVLFWAFAALILILAGSVSMVMSSVRSRYLR